MYEYIIDVLNNKLSQLTTVNPTFKDIMVREMLEPVAINVVRNTFCTVISGSITTSHKEKRPVKEVYRDALKVEIRQKVSEAIVLHFKDRVSGR